MMFGMMWGNGKKKQEHNKDIERLYQRIIGLEQQVDKLAGLLGVRWNSGGIKDVPRWEKCGQADASNSTTSTYTLISVWGKKGRKK